MPREQIPDQNLRNPGAFSPDDDEAQEADVTHAGEQGAEDDADIDAMDEDEGGEEANDEEQPLP